MGFFEINRTAAQQAIAYMGQAFSYRGSIYKGILNEFSTEQQLEIGAVMPTVVAALYVKKLGFPVPDIGEILTVDSTEYRIASVQSDAISFTLNLEHPAQ